MENEKISIELFRVSTDSKYLDMIFSCPDGYHFTSLLLEARYLDGKVFKSSFFDLSIALFGDLEPESDESDEPVEYQTRWVVRLPLNKIGIAIPAIYIGTFKAQDDEYHELIDKAICSDVNLAYRCMLDDLFMKEQDSSCEDVIPDEVIRKYLLLYGHQAAIAVEDLDTAQVYFKLISNCFGNCPSNGRGSGSCCGGNSKCDEGLIYRRPPVKSCNCGR